ncbi:hypothetical protein AB2T19_000130 [Clostridium botulinum]
MLDLYDVKVTEVIKQLANILRAEQNEQGNYLNLYANQETIDYINNLSNQVIYGRRGTGKTHLLKAYQELLINDYESKKWLPVYIDLRKLLPLISQENYNSEDFSVIVFKCIIQEILDMLIKNLKFIFALNIFTKESMIEKLKRDKLIEIFQNVNYEFDGMDFKKLGNFELSEQEVKKVSSSLELGKALKALLSGEKQVQTQKNTKSQKYISFMNLSKIISEIPDQLGINRIICLVDEWSEIPQESQMYLAELLKRAFITSKYSFKIAGIPHRTNLGKKLQSKYIGLEEGGDIFGFHLDNRYVFESNKQPTRDFFNELLYKHISALSQEIGVIYLNQTTGRAKNDFINEFFANQALSEILIASAGIPRDFINIFINAYNNFLLNTSTNNNRIGVNHVRMSTSQWYQTDKKRQIEKYPECKLLLDKIKDEIVLKKMKTHFLIPQKYADNKHLLQLIDLRAIHLRKLGYSHKDNAGVSYNVYSIDYGCYVVENIKQADLDTQLINEINTIENFRDIRRVSLEDDFFDEYYIQVGEGFKCINCNEVVDVNHPAYKLQKLCNHCFKKAEVKDNV